jgi:hypothetical protein
MWWARLLNTVLGSFSTGVAASTNSYESIVTATGTGSSGTITFSSIPATYSHLQIRYIAKSTDTSSAALYDFTIKFNGSSTSYAYHNISGNNTTAQNAVASTTSISTNKVNIPNSAASLANMQAVGILDIADYTSTTKNKTLRGFSAVDTNNTLNTSPVILFSGLWYATPAAITQIDLTLATGSWTTTSTFALYGIKGA